MRRTTETTLVQEEIDTPAQDAASAGDPVVPASDSPVQTRDSLVPTTIGVSSRRGFLRGALVVAGGAMAATVASCAQATGTAWSYAPLGTASAAVPPVDAEPYDAIIEADKVGVWALHCHILPHVEGLDGMFGMVTALVVTE